MELDHRYQLAPYFEQTGRGIGLAVTPYIDPRSRGKSSAVFARRRRAFATAADRHGFSLASKGSRPLVSLQHS